MRRALLLLLVAALAGCSNMGDYYKSVDQTNARAIEAERARAEADQARYMALARIAESGDAIAKVAAAMALAIGPNASGSRVSLVAPAVPQNEALQWGSLIVTGLNQGLSTASATRLGINASNNALRQSLGTNATFGMFASELSKPPLVVEQPPPVLQPAPVIVEQPPPLILNTGTVP